MTVVYKFAKRTHVDAAVDRGRIRLSHVATFRGDDGIEAGRSDSRELTQTAAILNGEETISSFDPRFAGMFTHIRGGVQVPMDIVVSGAETTSIGDGLLFCASREFSDEICDLMKMNFDADAAYEISDVREFGRRIEKHLLETSPHLVEIQGRIANQLANPLDDIHSQEFTLRYLYSRLELERPLTVTSGPVQYRDTSLASSIATMPAIDPFIKPRAYAWQQEYRLMVRPYSASNYLDLELPDLRELMRSIY